MNARKVWKKILGGSKNIRFHEMTTLLQALGFSLERVSGSHHIFEHLQVAALSEKPPATGNWA